MPANQVYRCCSPAPGERKCSPSFKEGALKREAPTIDLKVYATKRKEGNGCSMSAEGLSKVLDRGADATVVADKIRNEVDDDGEEEEDDESEEDLDMVYAECKKQHEEHFQQLLDSLPFVLKFKDYSIDSDGEEDGPVVWK